MTVTVTVTVTMTASTAGSLGCSLVVIERAAILSELQHRYLCPAPTPKP